MAMVQSSTQRAAMALQAAGFGKGEYQICWQNRRDARCGRGYQITVSASLGRVLQAVPVLVDGGLRVTQFCRDGRVESISLRTPGLNRPGSLETIEH